MELSIAYQLYSAKKETEQDFPGTLQQLKDMGYQGVELVGLYGYEPGELRNLLLKIGLVPVSAHVFLEEFLKHPSETIAAYQEAGCEYLVIPYLADSLQPSGGNFDHTVEFIANMGKHCREAGMTLLYHNHDFEFCKMEDGTYGLDYLYAHVPENLLQTEIDTCWVNYAGEEPCAYLKKYKNRSPLVHLKDFVGKKEEERSFQFKPLGAGVQNIKRLVETAKQCGSKWVVVEQDDHPERQALADAKISIDCLKEIIK